MNELVHVLLVYSLERQELVDQQTFSDSNEAQAAYAAAEKGHFLDSSVEIVLIASDSIDTIKHTHASYFNEDVGVALSDDDITRLLSLP